MFNVADSVVDLSFYGKSEMERVNVNTIDFCETSWMEYYEYFY